MALAWSQQPLQAFKAEPARLAEQLGWQHAVVGGRQDLPAPRRCWQGHSCDKQQVWLLLTARSLARRLLSLCCAQAMAPCCPLQREMGFKSVLWGRGKANPSGICAGDGVRSPWETQGALWEVHRWHKGRKTRQDNGHGALCTHPWWWQGPNPSSPAPSSGIPAGHPRCCRSQ